ncbi:pilus assembly protein [Actinospica sp. MGRD01-02]|uniref:Pilus assembly protein n=1 Tax=Actinospica acidithermotolerans TaxID=2828514 RepID=A0A941IGV7_9ACTN|nr:TadE/TadG family type IV pilus assembly protein [Actinospica acidithermotolerans]MBR7827835.1 pilus assembly protein [Actinospica acidithermotolerans]
MTRHTNPSNTLLRAARRRLEHVRAERERGSVVVELVLVVPIFIVLMLLIVALGRASDASIQVHDAAHAAARAATLATYPGAADGAAEQAASQALSESGTTCRSMNVSADVGNLTPGSMVSVTVSCTVDYQDLSGIDLPGAHTISATSTSVVDRYGSTTTGTTG